MKSKTLPVTVILVVAAAVIVNQVIFNRRKSTPVLETKAGALQGVMSLSREGRDIFEFLGIPYAQPPVGELRFEPPQKAKKWDGILDASKFGNKCPQLDLLFQGPDGNEDCLVLNVYTPHLPVKGGKDVKALPVMVFFHGGIFFFGSGSGYKADFLVDEDVILVTVNYRLGSLGFLNTGDGVVAGNMGLKDQSMALRWVQEYIQDFGGDPNQVTIFGQSAGAASVHFQLVSPMSKGLFQRAISQSGSALNPWTIWNDPAAQAKRFAGKFNCPIDNSREMIACMKNLTMSEILKAHEEVLLPFRDLITVFIPTVESGPPNANTFLPAHPRELLKSGKYHKVPWLVGANAQDGLLFSATIVRNETVAEIVYKDFNSVLPRILWLRDAPADVGEKIFNYYVTEQPNLDNRESFNKFTDMFTDRSFFNGIHEAAVLQRSHSPVYMYYYDYKGEFRPGNILIAVKRKYPVALEFVAYLIQKAVNEFVLGRDAPFYGVGHIDELAMLFHMPWLTNVRQEHKDYKLSQAMVKLWTSFAHNRTPLQFLDVPWAPLDPKDAVLKYLNISTSPSIINDPFAERYRFWESLNVSLNL